MIPRPKCQVNAAWASSLKTVYEVSITDLPARMPQLKNLPVFHYAAKLLKSSAVVSTLSTCRVV